MFFCHEINNNDWIIQTTFIVSAGVDFVILFEPQNPSFPYLELSLFF